MQNGEPAVGNMYPAGAYLLTWNPANWDWKTIQDDVIAVRAGRVSPNPGAQRWGTGVNGSIKKGARLFLLKQGALPRGIVGSAWATSDVFEDAHFDPARATAGDTARYVNL